MFHISKNIKQIYKEERGLPPFLANPFFLRDGHFSSRKATIGVGRAKAGASKGVSRLPRSVASPGFKTDRDMMCSGAKEGSSYESLPMLLAKSLSVSSESEESIEVAGDGKPGSRRDFSAMLDFGSRDLKLIPGEGNTAGTLICLAPFLFLTVSHLSPSAGGIVFAAAASGESFRVAMGTTLAGGHLWPNVP